MMVRWLMVCGRWLAELVVAGGVLKYCAGGEIMLLVAARR